MITEKEVKYVARLANLELNEEKKIQYTKQLNAILEYFKKLNELDTDEVQPTAYIDEMPNLLSNDTVKSSLPQSEVNALSENSKKGYFRVPKIM